MRRFLFLLSVILYISATAQLQSKIGYKNFLAKQDLIFDSLSTKWEEGAFLGNGLLGVMIYREDANAIRFDMGRTDVVDHREGINPSIGRARLPIGKFILHTTGNIQKIQLRLDLWNAELTGTITTDKGVISFRGLIAATKDVMIFNTSSTGKEKLFDWEWKPEPALSPFLTLGRDSANKYPSNPSAIITKENSINYSHQHLLVGNSYTTAWKEINSGNKQVFFVTITNSFPADNSKQLAQQILNSVTEKNTDAIVVGHHNYWHQFYHESFISFPDSRLQSFWWIQQYKIASATRAGSYPIDLMGPWYHITPWPKYWWNLNIQLTYYPFFSSNHIDLVKPLLKMINDHVTDLSKNAPEPYQYNSAALGRSGPYDMSSGIKVLKGNDSTGQNPSSLELGNLTWLLHVCWQTYEYTMDREAMKNIYPVLTRSINYYLNIIEKESDGKYHLPFTYSPEYPKGITRDANYDLSLLRWGCRTLLYINDQLKLKDALADKWQDILNNLTPFPQDERGLRVGQDASFTLSHRHYSHLLMIYPIYEINWDQPENRDLIQRSLHQWESNNEAWRGYSYTGSGSIYAMMGNGNKTHQLLNEMIDKGRFAIKPNTMYLEAGPVIETPLSAVTTINEMLLQSWSGIVRVFPAVPDEWKEASFHDLRARGSFLVSAVRKNGATQFIRIKSLAGKPCLVKTGWVTDVKAVGKRKFIVTKKNDGTISIDLKKGEEAVLYTGIKPSSFEIMEATSDKNENYWGLHKK
jgi:alpha-L-fucosidase 2